MPKKINLRSITVGMKRIHSRVVICHPVVEGLHPKSDAICCNPAHLGVEPISLAFPHPWVPVRIYFSRRDFFYFKERQPARLKETSDSTPSVDQIHGRSLPLQGTVRRRLLRGNVSKSKLGNTHTTAHPETNSDCKASSVQAGEVPPSHPLQFFSPIFHGISFFTGENHSFCILPK